MALVGALVCRGPALAYDLNDKLSIGGVLAGAGQCQDLSHATADDRCMAALSVQPEVDFHPTKSDQLFFKLGFAAGNGLNEDSPFLILAWAKATIRFWWRVHRLTF
jgi:porin